MLKKMRYIVTLFFAVSILTWEGVDGTNNGGKPPIPCAYSPPGYANEGKSAPCSSYGPAPKTAPYSYSYSAPVGVKADGMLSASETSDGKGTITGSYSLNDPDGRQRRVYYMADAMGFRAKVMTNEPGTANENPADVVVMSSYSAPKQPKHPVPESDYSSGGAYKSASDSGSSYTGYVTAAPPPAATSCPHLESTSGYEEMPDPRKLTSDTPAKAPYKRSPLKLRGAYYGRRK